MRMITPREHYCLICRASLGRSGKRWACDACVHSGLTRLVYRAALQQWPRQSDYALHMNAPDDPLEPVPQWIVNAIAADVLRAAVVEARRMVREGEIIL